jgi:hypothetical protein
MPVHAHGRGCFQWGAHGHIYCGPGAYQKAERQGRAAYSHGYKGKEMKTKENAGQGMRIGWMDAYVYAADLYCEDCGRAIQKKLPEDTGDSDSYPQGPYPDGGGESDGPQHCGMGDGCPNAMTLEGVKIGVWLGNPLTSDGVEYMKEMLSNPNANAYQKALHEFWSEVYADYLADPGMREVRESEARSVAAKDLKPGDLVRGDRGTRLYPVVSVRRANLNDRKLQVVIQSQGTWHFDPNQIVQVYTRETSISSEAKEGRHQPTDRTTNNAIRIWMKANANQFTDRQTGELNTTALVEAWDIECANGSATLDPNHPAWDIASQFTGYQSVHEQRHTVREINFHKGERLRIRIKGPQGQPFESFWYTVDTQGMTLTDIALQFAQTGQPGMLIEIISPTNSAGTQPRLKWTFRQGRHAGQPSVERVRGVPGQ